MWKLPAHTPFTNKNSCVLLPNTMKLVYKAVTRDGKKVEGVLDARDKTQAAIYLRSQNIYPIKFSLVHEKEFVKLLPFFNKVKFSELVFFTRQISSMLTSGITLIEGLRILKDQTPSKAMKEIIEDIVAEIEDGKALSTAIARHPEVFSPIYVSLMKAAEGAGLLDKVLLRLAENLEKQQKLQSSVKGALLYPIIVFIMMIAVFFVMMIFVIPQLAGLYRSLNVDLPFITKIIIGLSDVIAYGWPIMIIAGIILYMLYLRWMRTQSGRLIRDEFILKLPVFGRVIKGTLLAEFSRTLGLMVGAGTSIVEALTKTADTASNVLYKEAILTIAREVEQGMPVGEAMSTFSIFPPVLIQMAKIGEETGKLDESLLRVSEYFERDVDGLVITLTTALEPIILIVLGVGVGFLIFGIITPIYGLLSNIK